MSIIWQHRPWDAWHRTSNGAECGWLRRQYPAYRGRKIYYGRRKSDAPDIDAKVYFTAARAIAEGEFVEVRIHEALEYDLVGEAITDSEE